jgi:hypothetical protein
VEIGGKEDLHKASSSSDAWPLVDGRTSTDLQHLHIDRGAYATIAFVYIVSTGAHGNDGIDLGAKIQVVAGLRERSLDRKGSISIGMSVHENV